MSTARYRVIRDLRISDPAPHNDIFRNYVPGDFIELELEDAILMMGWRWVVFDGDAAPAAPAVA